MASDPSLIDETVGLILGKPVFGGSQVRSQLRRHCFEEVCTVSETSEPNGRFCSIVSRRLGDLNIVMAGEVDCAQGDS